MDPAAPKAAPIPNDDGRDTVDGRDDLALVGGFNTDMPDSREEIPLARNIPLRPRPGANDCDVVDGGCGTIDCRYDGFRRLEAGVIDYSTRVLKSPFSMVLWRPSYTCTNKRLNS